MSKFWYEAGYTASYWHTAVPSEVKPYSRHPASSPPPAPIPPQEPLTLSTEDIAKLSKYLPSPRQDFLYEDEPLSNKPEPSRGRMHVTLTYAQSLDSQISLQPGQRTTLSGTQTKSMTHYLRSHHDAILVGIGTVLADNPGLNTRYSEDGINIVGLERQPRPFILDPSRRLKLESCRNMLALARQGLGRAPWWLISEDRRYSEEDLRTVDKLYEYGSVELRAGRYKSSAHGVDWETILGAMWDKGVRSVMIEGGATVINDLLQSRNQRFISSIVVTIAPTYLGSGGVVVAPHRTKPEENEASLKNLTWIQMGQDMVMAGTLQDTCKCEPSGKHTHGIPGNAYEAR